MKREVICKHSRSAVHIPSVRAVLLFLSTPQAFLCRMVFVCLFMAFAGVALASPVEDWQVFETAVRDGALVRQEAQLTLDPLVNGLSTYITTQFDLHAGTWAFPLEGYDIHAMDRHDFKPHIVYGPYGKKGYDFFDGNKHGGHPAFDIFIHDKDRDCIDDRTRAPVRCCAMADAVVISLHGGWEKKSRIRGGNYVWLYSPSENKFFYYAHLNEITVQSGQLVRAGEAIGAVGRTGAMAADKRSPTHIHLMVLEFVDGKLLPYNYFIRLK